ncbi:UNVERIFIED_CONTAM: Phosphatidylinositol 4-kinase gamma 8 [Sesamum calycinum]|uniref:1-phosphatidylinositol 4-kinase n=1 Tax=Sesamum calycinum TaxID=2727403 RepID=A0AAW2N372_9LAMI
MIRAVRFSHIVGMNLFLSWILWRMRAVFVDSYEEELRMLQRFKHVWCTEISTTFLVVDFCSLSSANLKNVMYNLPGQTNLLEINQPLACAATLPASTRRLFKMAVAVDQAHGFTSLARLPRCKRKSSSKFDYEMLDISQSELTQSLEHAFNFTYIHKSFSTPCLSHSSRPEDDSATNPRIEIIVGHDTPQIHALVVEVAVAMASGVNPEPVASGLGGAYFLRAKNGDKIAVAKPVDEEPLAFNNPKGYNGRMLGQPGMKGSIRIGETGLRESAAYLLDHGGFAGVPPTALVEFSHVQFNSNSSGSNSSPLFKIASLQRFVDHDSDAGDMGPSTFSVADVHHIGILDIRLMNLDRHAGNILVRKQNESYGRGDAELVPIDHGYCLPESLTIRISSGCIGLRLQFRFQRLQSNTEINGGEENWSALENLCMIAKARLNNGLSDDNVIKSDHVEEDIDVAMRIASIKRVRCSSCFSQLPRKRLLDILSSKLQSWRRRHFFRDMDNDEWHSFLSTFEKLCPKPLRKEHPWPCQTKDVMEDMNLWMFIPIGLKRPKRSKKKKARNILRGSRGHDISYSDHDQSPTKDSAQKAHTRDNPLSDVASCQQPPWTTSTLGGGALVLGLTGDEESPKTRERLLTLTDSNSFP